MPLSTDVPIIYGGLDKKNPLALTNNDR